MDGLMMDTPLSLIHLFDRGTRLFADKQIVTSTPGGMERLSYGDWGDRTRRLGGMLDDLDISGDGRVATFAWNNSRHLELYFAAPCTGRVSHTLNLRLFPEQLTYIVEGALRFWIGDPEAGEVQEMVVAAGEVLYIPSWVPHRAEALEDTFDLDVFSPPRQDWLDGTDTYFHQK